MANAKKRRAAKAAEQQQEKPRSNEEQARLNDAAMIGHEAARYYGRAVGANAPEDDRQKPWAELSERQREAVRDLVSTGDYEDAYEEFLVYVAAFIVNTDQPEKRPIRDTPPPLEPDTSHSTDPLDLKTAPGA